MKFIVEYNKYFKEGDTILIEYWYNDMITPVKIVNKTGRTYTVSHDVKGSKIQNAPDEKIKSKDIIDHYRSTDTSEEPS